MRTERAALGALFVGLGALGTLAACADILSIEPPEPLDAGNSSLVLSAIAYDGGIPIARFPFDARAVCGDGEAPQLGSVYVSTHGSSDTSCGTRNSPCNSVSVGLLHAKVQMASTVVVAQGLYEETVVLIPSVTIQGGWDDNFNWICDPESVQIRSPGGTQTTTILASSIGSATLENLTVSSSDEAPPDMGLSVYGIVVEGNTTLILKNVGVIAGNAGSGVPGKMGGSGAPGGKGGCEPGGNTPIKGTQGGAGSAGQQGVAGASGYTPSVGGTGGTGGLGSNDSSGACGGQGGQGGLGGGGGGSSVAVYLSGEAVVQVTGGLLQSGQGGIGGAGGQGGAGGPGGSAKAGSGGPGGTGGGGGGGNSFLIFFGGGQNGSLTSPTTVTQLGHAGTGGSGGNMGIPGTAVEYGAL
jgi:hypothetical protein